MKIMNIGKPVLFFLWIPVFLLMLPVLVLNWCASFFSRGKVDSSIPEEFGIFIVILGVIGFMFYSIISDPGIEQIQLQILKDLK